MKSAVLFIIFNRPNTTKKVFEVIRQAKPPKLYIAADGPRQDRESEYIVCDETRKIATKVDWDCEVKTLFREKNLGCANAVSGAINWFFEQEEEGIILEDDVLPVSTFFEYCDELLVKFRNDYRIGMISGCNLVWNKIEIKYSYLFSIYNHIWGWATWRRSWKYYDITMKDWPEWRESGNLEKLSGGNKPFVSFWKRWMDIAYAGLSNSRDSQWHYTCWKNGWINVLPKYNQTFNIGFYSDAGGATHPIGDVPQYIIKSQPKPLEFPLVHPQDLVVNNYADKLISKYVYGIFMIDYKKDEQIF